MTENSTQPTPTLASDEKSTPVMIYTPQALIWGKVISKEAIRVNIWLRTDVAPLYMRLIDAQVLLIGGRTSPKPVKHATLYVQTNQIIAFHLLPPAEEPLDYDPDEPNRIMQPTTALLGFFQFDGSIRMSAQTELDNFLNASKGEFLPLYNAKMTCPAIPSIKAIQTPLVLIQQKVAMFTPQE
jgi:hypothetical protein